MTVVPAALTLVGDGVLLTVKFGVCVMVTAASAVLLPASLVVMVTVLSMIAIAARTVVVDVGLLHDITCGAGLGATRGEIARWAGLIASQWVSNGDAGQGDVAGVFNRDGIVDRCSGSTDAASVTASCSP